MEKIPFDLRKSLRKEMKTFETRAHDKGLSFAFEVDPEVPELLVGDSTRLQQILKNLVANALKFTDWGQVRVNVWKETGASDTAVLHFAVQDTGIGIRADKRESIFDASAQADACLTGRFGGMGLAISRHMAGWMGGRIWVESELGRGSTFHFTVPLGIK